MKCMIVEDDTGLANGIRLTLQKEGREFFLCNTLREARRVFQEQKLDLILLDVGLPDGSGLDYCREIRNSTGIPILFLTANDMEYDEVEGLEAGGDDYITKPFSLAVLRARVETALRRTGENHRNYFEAADYVFDFDAMEFYKGGRAVTLSKTEQKLLRMLVENRGRVLTREQLLDGVWSDGGDYVDENALSVSVGRLRGKLEDDPKKPRYIQTVYGMGYSWREKSDIQPEGRKERGKL